MSKTNTLHPFLKSASIAFLFMAVATVWSADGQLLQGRLNSGGGTTLLDHPQAVRFVQGGLHSAAPAALYPAPDTAGVQLMLGTLFLFGGLLFYALLVMKSGATVDWPFAPHIRKHAHHVKSRVASFLDHEFLPKSRHRHSHR